jgi:ATP-dependent DNA helicase RecQ
VVVPIPSTRHPRLIGTLAEAVSQIGRIPVAEALEVTGAPSTSDLAAKARAAFQTARLALLPGVDLGGEVVLLVDDRWQTGWTATLAGALLRRAGASRVLPLVVHQQP